MYAGLSIPWKQTIYKPNIKVKRCFSGFPRGLFTKSPLGRGMGRRPMNTAQALSESPHGDLISARGIILSPVSPSMYSMLTPYSFASFINTSTGTLILPNSYSEYVVWCTQRYEESRCWLIPASSRNSLSFSYLFIRVPPLSALDLVWRIVLIYNVWHHIKPIKTNTRKNSVMAKTVTGMSWPRCRLFVKLSIGFFTVRLGQLNVCVRLTLALYYAAYAR